MKYIILLFCVSLVFCSCDDFLTEETETGVTNNNFWKNASDVDAAVNGLYATFRFNHANNNNMYYRDRALLFDGITGAWANANNNQLWKSWSSIDGCLNWNREYDIISSANGILDNMDRAELSPERYNFYLSQALGIRGYMYFYILKNWGDAPLVLHAEDVGAKARTPWQEIAELSIAELKQAASLLPRARDLVDIDGKPITSKQVFSKGTCQAILAHEYAWKAALNGEPELNKIAIAYCDSVIADDSYGLVDNINEVCEIVIKGNSKEGILECDFENNEIDSKGYAAYFAGNFQWWPVRPLTTPSTARRGLLIKNSTVYSIYPDAKDFRREEYFYKLDSMAKVATSITKGNAYVQKFRHVIVHESGNLIGQIKDYDINEIFIRLADIILLRAELRVKTGDEAGAIKDLNRIRERAGCSPYNAAVDGDLAGAIQDERDREFFCEGAAIRYYDVVRNGTFRERLRGDFKTLTDQDVTDGALYFPVASTAFYNNTLMLQTPYWKRNGYAY